LTLDVTERARLETRKTQIEPQLVLEIEGVVTLFGAVEILRLIRIGDPGLLIGNDWRIGGLTPVDDQAAIMSFDSGGGTSIDQQLQPDKGSVSSVTSVQVGLIDKNLIATRLISPGVTLPEILGVKATLWMGFKNTAFKQDYVPIMSGLIDDVESGPGVVKLNIAHPEQLKRQKIFDAIEGLLASPISNVDTVVPLVSAANMPRPQLGPDGVTYDSTIKFYVQIEDEIIRYTGVSGNNLTGCVRAELATTNVAHAVPSDGQPTKSLVQLSGPAVYIALKTMLSGVNGPFKEDVAVTAFNHPDVPATVANSLFFGGVDLTRDYGVTVGDYVTTTLASNGANNVTAKVITQIESTDAGSYAVIAGVTFVDEPGTVAVVAIRSQFDTLGYGLGMTPDQVDVTEHVYWHNFQLAPFTYRFVLTDTVDGKEFLDKQVYKPIGAFSIPRRGRCSMGYHVGPVIRDVLPVLSRDNIKSPDKIKLRRTVNKNFYNAVVYKFDKQIASGKYASGDIEFSPESRNRIKVGSRPLVIESDGLRRSLDGSGIAERIGARYLLRYRYAPEFYESIGILFRDGYPIEPGDSVLFDPTDLNISNLETGTRKKTAKVFSVINKKLDLKTGDCTVSLTDTNFDESERYGSVSPSSLVVSGTTTSLLVQDSFGAFFPGNESKKWVDYLGLPIRVHSADFTFDEEVTLLSIDPGNQYNLLIDPATPLSGAPLAGYIIDVGDYPDTALPDDNARYKAAHAFMGPTVSIVSAPDDTHFVVAPGDVVRFVVGDFIRVHDADFTNDSGELEITDVTGTTVTVISSMGFTPAALDVAEGMQFPDGGKTYRFF